MVLGAEPPRAGGPRRCPGDSRGPRRRRPRAGRSPRTPSTAGSGAGRGFRGLVGPRSPGVVGRHRRRVQRMRYSLPQVRRGTRGPGRRRSTLRVGALPDGQDRAVVVDQQMAQRHRGGQRLGRHRDSSRATAASSGDTVRHSSSTTSAAMRFARQRGAALADTAAARGCRARPDLRGGHRGVPDLEDVGSASARARLRSAGAAVVVRISGGQTVSVNSRQAGSSAACRDDGDRRRRAVRAAAEAVVMQALAVARCVAP